MNVAQQRRIWPINWWPDSDRQMWTAACAGFGLLGDSNPAFAWSPQWRQMIESAYGRYIGWLCRTGSLIDIHPADRIHPDIFSEFVAELHRQGLADTSIAGCARSIRAFAGAVAPERDWQWLARRAFRMKARAVPRHDKRLRVVSSLHLFKLGFDLMDRSATAPTDLAASLQFRDGLMVALLAARPLRISNFSRLELGRTLLYRSPEYWLCISEQETKTGRPISMPLPDALHHPLDRFLRGPRKILLRSRTADGPTSALWLSGNGRPLRPEQIRTIINTRTKAAFGHSVNPHLFRDCLATTLATDDPEHVLCAVPILGHSSFRTMEKHYNQAIMGTATRKFASALLEFRNDLIGQFGLHDARTYLIALEGRGNATP